jgi:hypothetical protein
MKQKLAFLVLAVFFLVGTGYAQVKGGKQNPRKLQVSLEALNNQTPQATPVTRAPGDVKLTQNFNSTSGTGFPTGWLTNPSSGGTAGITRWATGAGSFAYPTGNGNTYTYNYVPHGGTGKCAFIYYNSSAAHNAWFATPAVALTAGLSYTISFWTVMEGYGGFEELELWAATSATAPTANTLPTVMATGSKIWENKTEDYLDWTEITVLFTPSTTGNYYFGWHNTSFDKFFVLVDDITITETAENSLSVTPQMSYTQIPISQTVTASAQTKNIGYAAQTNVTLAAEMNGSAVGTPVSAPSLAVGATAALSISGIAVPLGSNILTYTVSSTEGATATANVSFTGSADTYAVDNATTGGIGSNAGAISFGNIFEITNATNMLAAKIGFGNAADLDYTVSLYQMTGDLQVASIPLFTQAAHRNATGLVTVDVPPTALVPGKYFLCVNQLTATNLSVNSESASGKILYVLNSDFTLNGTTGMTAAIRMVVGNPQADDIAVSVIAAPVNGENLTAAELVTVNLLNHGANTITSFDLELTVDGFAVATEPFIGNLASGASTNYTFTATADLSVAGYHTITVRAILAGDGNADNDFKTITVFNLVCDNTFPLSENFETQSYLCWTMLSNNAVNGPGGPGSYPMGVVSVSGNKVLQFSSYDEATVGTNPYYQYFISRELPASCSELTFSFRSARSSSGIETFRVGYSTATNAVADFTWLTEVSQTVTAGSFTNRSFTIPAGAKFVAINYTSNYQYRLYIDDIVIKPAVDNDAAITTITAPVSGDNLTAAEQVTVTIQNLGTNTITSLDLQLTVDGVSVTETFTGSIPPCSSVDYTFTATADLSIAGDHTVVVTATLTDDGKADNDELSVTVTNTVNDPCTVVTTYPFTEGFEDYTGVAYNVAGIVPDCWYSAGDVATVIPHITGSGSYWYPHSGSKAITFTGGASYAGVNSYVVLPALDKSLDEIKISFWYQYEDANIGTLTVGYITGSQDNVSSYVPLLTVPATTTVTQMEYIFASAGVDLSAATYIAFRWNYTGGSFYSAGIDDINVDVVVANDAAITAITAPVSGQNLTSTEPVTVTIQNNGTDPITSVQLTLTVDGVEVDTETYTGSIATGATYNYTFTATADLSTAGDHIITVTATLTGDADTDNDTFTVTVNNTVCPTATLSLSENFETDSYLCWIMISKNTVNGPDGTGSYPMGVYDYTDEGFGHVMIFSSVSSVSNYSQYLISPEFTVGDNICSLTVDFDAAIAYNSLYATEEKFKVGYSTTTNDVSAFTWLEENSVTNNVYLGDDYQHFTIEIPVEAKYIAIWYTSIYEYLLGIDNIVVNEVPCTDVVDNSLSNIKVYPNPVTDNVVIENAAGSRARIYDISGKVIFDANITDATQTVNIGNISAGVYFMELQNQNSKSTVKLIKK